MKKNDLPRRVTAEFIGTFFLLSAVVGSGIMAERLAGGSEAIALLANTISTGAALVCLILIFGPVSGAHFNPLVSVVDSVINRTDWKDIAPYMISQIAGAIAGVVAANLMFSLPPVVLSSKIRTGPGLWLGEFIATFGLIAVVAAVSRYGQSIVSALAVGSYITAAYWFTSSTSFANPAVTLARSLSDSFAGISPSDVPAFVGAQLLGAVAAAAVCGWLFRRKPVDDQKADEL